MEAAEDELDLGGALGAGSGESFQVLALYIPDRDRHGEEIGTQRRWVIEAANLLARIGGGVTIEPPVEGGWLDDENGNVIWERPVRLYTYVIPEPFKERIGELRALVGRETNQGEVVVEFDGHFFRIREFEGS